MRTQIFPATSAGFWSKAVAWLNSALCLNRRTSKRLRLCESLPLGERRFVAVVEFERARFLLGGTGSSLVLLSRLENIEPSPPDDPRGRSCSQ